MNEFSEQPADVNAGDQSQQQAATSEPAYRSEANPSATAAKRSARRVKPVFVIVGIVMIVLLSAITFLLLGPKQTTHLPVVAPPPVITQYASPASAASGAGQGADEYERPAQDYAVEAGTPGDSSVGHESLVPIDAIPDGYVSVNTRVAGDVEKMREGAATSVDIDEVNGLAMQVEELKASLSKVMSELSEGKLTDVQIANKIEAISANSAALLKAIEDHKTKTAVQLRDHAIRLTEIERLLHAYRVERGELVSDVQTSAPRLASATASIGQSSSARSAPEPNRDGAQRSAPSGIGHDVLPTINSFRLVATATGSAVVNSAGANFAVHQGKTYGGLGRIVLVDDRNEVVVVELDGIRSAIRK